VPIVDPLDLIDARVTIPAEANGGTALTVNSPFASDATDLSQIAAALLDDVTVVDQPVLPARISLSEAPVEVLAAIPGWDAQTVERVIEARSRPATDPTARRSVGWIWSEGIVDLTTMKRVHSYLTVGGDVMTAQVIGFRDDHTPFHRVTVVFDASVLPARTRAMQTWHSWGRGFSTLELRGEASATSLPTGGEFR